MADPLESFRRELFVECRPKVSCWFHFAPELHDPAAAVEAHARHVETFGLDFCKVMYEYGYPRGGLGKNGVIESVEGLRKLRELPGTTPPFDRQLGLLHDLRQRTAGMVPLTTTVFHPWMELRNLVRPPKDLHRPPVIDVGDNPVDRKLTELLRDDRDAVAAALAALGGTLANFARACLDAGADGIYLATRDDWVDTPPNRVAAGLAETESVYDRYVADADRHILAGAARGWFNVVHLCGRPLSFTRHVTTPHVNVIHWADRVTGPSLTDARTQLESALGDNANTVALAAGVDNLNNLPRGTPDDVRGEVHQALQAAGDRPLIIAPGCTYAPETVPERNIRALVEAVRASQGG